MRVAYVRKIAEMSVDEAEQSGSDYRYEIDAETGEVKPSNATTAETAGSEAKYLVFAVAELLVAAVLTVNLLSMGADGIRANLLWAVALCVLTLAALVASVDSALRYRTGDSIVDRLTD
jgi:hypothetical protein